MNLPDKFLKNRDLVMVDFYADWCEPCKWADPVMEQVLNGLGKKIDLEKIDIDQEPHTAKDFHVLSVPTFILFREGVEIWRMRGFDTAPKVIRQLEDVLL
jgi:thioredoxin 1